MKDSRTLRFEPLEARHMLAVSVVPTVETDSVGSADDIAIWIHPTDTSKSTIIGTAKSSSDSLRVFNLAGDEIQRVDVPRVNNVDLRYNFTLSGQAATLLTGSNRADDSIVIYRIDPQTGTLQDVAARTIDTDINIYGLAMYVSPDTGNYYVFVTSESGHLQQWRLFDNGAGRVDAELVRSLSVGSIAEGIVADDVLGHLYVGEENVGIWKYSAEPDGGGARTLVDSTDATGHLDDDVEGLTIYYVADGTGFLIASSQGNDEFVVYRREGGNEYLGSFELSAGGGIDAVSDTDGIDVVNYPLGDAFPLGLFVAQDNDANYKLVRWDAIRDAFGGLLAIDTSWDPRLVGADPDGGALHGDFNHDNDVDAADYSVWRDSLGTYDEDDYDAWKANFGGASTSPSAPTVDETSAPTDVERRRAAVFSDLFARSLSPHDAKLRTVTASRFAAVVSMDTSRSRSLLLLNERHVDEPDSTFNEPEANQFETLRPRRAMTRTQVVNNAIDAALMDWPAVPSP